MSSGDYHASVLLQEVIHALRIVKGEKYIDATIGGGGHTKSILDLGGIVLGIDVDQQALDHVRDSFDRADSSLVLVRGNFRNIDTLAQENGFGLVSGIIFDFGVSSHQIENPERGFSFMKTGPLDMRMDQRLTVTAKDLINGLHKKELFDLFERFGEEQFAHGIATKIVNVRKNQTIETTSDLMKIIESVIPAKLNRMSAAARIFQSIRIIVNDELNAISETLPKALELLKPGGRIVALSFHSLEDRLVKQQFKQWRMTQLGHELTKVPIYAGEEEIALNIRSRSVKMRIFEKN